MSLIGARAGRCSWRRLAAAAGARRWAGSEAGPGPAPGGESPLRRLLDEASAFGEAEPAERELQWATQPYAARAPAARGRPPPEAVAPSDATVVLFPGQGAHRVGMGLRLRDVPAARDLYALASDVLGWDVWRVCTEGPAEELERRCQPALLVTALAALEAARERRPGAVERARAAAGFSLGEFAALVFAGALPLEGALRVLQVREEATARAARGRPQGLLTAWLAPAADVAGALRAARDAAAAAGVREPVCCVANHLFPGCKVLGGDEAALRHLEAGGGAWGVRRTQRVRTARAFHTPLMAPAEEAVREALALVPLAPPRLRVVAGAEARAYRSPAHVARGLARLAAAPLRWEQTLHALYARDRRTPQPLTLALGPGGALRATLRQVNALAWDCSLLVDV